MSRQNSSKRTLSELAGSKRAPSWKTKAALAAGVGVPLGLVFAAEPAAANEFTYDSTFDEGGFASGEVGPTVVADSNEYWSEPELLELAPDGAGYDVADYIDLSTPAPDVFVSPAPVDSVVSDEVLTVDGMSVPLKPTVTAESWKLPNDEVAHELAEDEAPPSVLSTVVGAMGAVIPAAEAADEPDVDEQGWPLGFDRIGAQNNGQVASLIGVSESEFFEDGEKPIVETTTDTNTDNTITTERWERGFTVFPWTGDDFKERVTTVSDSGELVSRTTQTSATEFDGFLKLVTVDHESEVRPSYSDVSRSVVVNDLAGPKQVHVAELAAEFGENPTVLLSETWLEEDWRGNATENTQIGAGIVAGVATVREQRDFDVEGEPSDEAFQLTYDGDQWSHFLGRGDDLELALQHRPESVEQFGLPYGGEVRVLVPNSILQQPSTYGLVIVRDGVITNLRVHPDSVQLKKELSPDLIEPFVESFVTENKASIKLAIPDEIVAPEQPTLDDSRDPILPTPTPEPDAI